MDNFNRALRINYLEEQLLRMQNGMDFATDELEAELVQLRLAVKERNHELRQRDVTITRDTATIKRRDEELHQQKEYVTTLTRQLKELKDKREQDEEIRLEKTHEQIEKMAALSAETAQLKQVIKERDEQVTKLQLQMETMQQDRDALETRYQLEMKTVEERVQREGDHFRTELVKLVIERERAYMDKDRIMEEMKSMTRERARVQDEMEQMTKERLQLADETEWLRVDNVKLTTAWEELKKSFDGMKTDREAVVRTIDELKSELDQKRKLEMEHAMAMTTLQSQLEDAQVKACKMEEQAAQVSVMNTAARQLKVQYDVEKSKQTRQLVTERRRANEMERAAAAVKNENKSLLKAISIYKDAIASRDEDIEKLKSAVMKYKNQLQQRVEFGDVKQTLLDQLEQTQRMITKTSKRWEDSLIVRGSSTSGKVERCKAASLKLDEFINRMHVV